MRIFVAMVAVLLLGGFGLAWRPAIEPVTPPAVQTFPASTVALGAQLATAGSCAACHTVAGAAPFAGGLGLETGFGLVYSTNISPDQATGIGNWSQAAFTRAMREGVSRDGTQLLPAFPYTHFTKLTDDDTNALYAYLMTRAPVTSPKRDNTIAFPLNIRALQAGWKLLFFDAGRYQAVADKSAPWNRGAYLAEGLTHCAACHTPRNRFGAERSNAAYAGAKIDGWEAPALNAANPAPMPWTQQDLYDYLRTGESELHGVAVGPMANVVHQGLASLPDADVQALAVYFADTNGSAERAAASAGVLTQTGARRLVDVGKETEPGANLYLSACASCHYDPAPKPPKLRGSLALSTAISSADPANFIRTVLGGIGGADSANPRGPYMPGFAGALTDADVALLASYVRRTRTDLPAWQDLLDAVAANRSHTPTTP